MSKTEEWVKEARARGAIQVDDSQPGSGFDDTEPIQSEEQLGPELVQATRDLEDRIGSMKVPSSADEMAKEWAESNSEAVRKQKLPFQNELTDWHPGKILWMGDFLNMLQKIRPDAFLAEYSFLGLRGLGFAIGGIATYSGVSVQNGNAPEWSQFRVDSHGIAISERKRGWRAVLLALIRNRYITLEDSDRIFGRAELSNRSKPWWRALYCIRNGKCPECRKPICICGDGYDSLRADKYAYPVPESIVKGKQQHIDKPSDNLIWTP